MKSPIIAYVGWLLVLSAVSFYVYGIYEAIYLSLGKMPIGETDYHPVLASTVGSIQALLLANLGILLGISIAKPNSNIARQLMLNKPNNKTSFTAEIPPPLDIREKIQLVALVLYVVSLIACLATWIANNFSADSKDVVSVVPEAGKMFIGVVLAYLTAVLSKQPG